MSRRKGKTESQLANIATKLLLGESVNYMSTNIRHIIDAYEYIKNIVEVRYTYIYSKDKSIIGVVFYPQINANKND